MFCSLVLCSSFSDIYDEDHFIKILQGHVKVTRELPEELIEKYNNISNMKYLRVPAWASSNFYLEEVLPVLQKRRLVIHDFSNFVAYNYVRMPSFIMKLKVK